MVTMKNLWNVAASEVLGAPAAHHGAQARKPSCDLRSSPLDSLDPAASHADHTDCYGDYGDAPAPTVPFFNSADGSAAAVPCFDVELVAALELLTAHLDAAAPAPGDDDTLPGLDDVALRVPYTH